MYNLLEYSSSYSDTTGSLWFYSKDQATNFNNDIVKTHNSKSFKHKIKLLEDSCRWKEWSLEKCNNYCAIKRLSNLWRSLEMPLINYKV